MIDIDHSQSVSATESDYMLLHFALFGFMNNILSGTKYRASPEGVSLIDETNNPASHLERFPLIHGYCYESAGDRSSLLCQPAPKIQILRAICALNHLSGLRSTRTQFDAISCHVRFCGLNNDQKKPSPAADHENTAVIKRIKASGHVTASPLFRCSFIFHVFIPSVWPPCVQNQP